MNSAERNLPDVTWLEIEELEPDHLRRTVGAGKIGEAPAVILCRPDFPAEGRTIDRARTFADSVRGFDPVLADRFDAAIQRAIRWA